MTFRLFLALAIAATAACQGDVATPFPPGLEPLEDNIIPVQQGGAYAEGLRTMSVDTDYIKIYGRGYVLASPGATWAGSKNPLVDMAVCSTDERMVTPDDQPEYEYSFVVHYIVHNVLTVEWDDQWRFGTIAGTPEMPMLAAMKHQKVQGSDFITLSEGTVQVLTTDDPDVTELSFVEHLDAAGGSVADVLAGVQYHYDAMVAAAHGNPLPACP